MKYLCLILSLGLLMACDGEEFLEEAEPSINSAPEEFESNTSLDGLVRGAYFNLKTPGDVGAVDLLMYQTIATDVVELKEYANVVSGGRNMLPWYSRDPEINNIRYVELPWAGAYTVLYNVNTVLQFYEENEPPQDGFEGWVPHLRGEAYFLRAFAHYLLVTTYAPPFSSDPQAPSIILMTTPANSPTDYRGLATVQEVYDQIIADLKMAIELLPEAYDPNVQPENYQDRAKRDAARFLLAKVYFLMGNEFWNSGQGDGGALEQINTIISSGQYPLVQSDSLQQIFLNKGLGQKASETVWYLAYYFRNAWRAPRFERVYSDFTGSRTRGFAFSGAVLEDIGWNDSTVAKQDERYNDWFRRYEAGEDPAYSAGEYVDPYNVWCTKFTNRTANFVVFRSPELYLMRAAIRLADGDATGAAEDLNVTRTRAGLESLSTATEADVSTEWIKEMGFEGRRLFYLQGTQQPVPPGDRMDVGPIPYNDPLLVRKLPEIELIRNPALAGG